MDTIDDTLGRLRWLGHSSFRLDFDPWQLATNSPPADLILITHEHHDHCSPEDVTDVRRMRGPVTVLRPGERAKGGRRFGVTIPLRA